MSLLILDNQIDERRVLPALNTWTKVTLLRKLRPGQVILDDRVPEILGTLRQPTFITIDEDFWHPHWRHPSYCILYFWLRDEEQLLIPGLLRTLLRVPEFRTRKGRMGKVGRVSPGGVDYWQVQSSEQLHLEW